MAEDTACLATQARDSVVETEPFSAAGNRTAKARAAGRAAGKAKADVRGADLADTVKELQASGTTSLRAIAEVLDARGIPTAREGTWSATQVLRLLERIGPFEDTSAAAA
jgi:hypothetical protein